MLLALASNYMCFEIQWTKHCINTAQAQWGGMASYFSLKITDDTWKHNKLFLPLVALDATWLHLHTSPALDSSQCRSYLAQPCGIHVSTAVLSSVVSHALTPHCICVESSVVHYSDALIDLCDRVSNAARSISVRSRSSNCVRNYLSPTSWTHANLPTSLPCLSWDPDQNSTCWVHLNQDRSSLGWSQVQLAFC